MYIKRDSPQGKNSDQVDHGGEGGSPVRGGGAFNFQIDELIYLERGGRLKLNVLRPSPHVKKGSEKKMKEGSRSVRGEKRGGSGNFTNGWRSSSGVK